jgi:histidyl-tRNA synthetase
MTIETPPHGKEHIMKLIQRVKGTQDFLDYSLFSFIIQEFKKHAVLYHFHEIATPIIEPVELFKRSLGLFTDVVSKEMFLIKTHEDQEQLCLRPEATAPTMRAFLEVQPLTPWKVFSQGPMFRYERPQKGRFRQFHQINCEVIGSSSISQDVLLITMLDRYFHERLHLNNYALQINFLGSYEDRAAYTGILKTFIDSLTGICVTCQERKEKNILRIFDCKNETCQSLYQKAPKMIDHLSTESQKEWEQLQEELLLLSVTFSINPYLVRGLDYYNKTVFEFSSQNLGAQNAFCGGGRYDRLAQELGSMTPYPSLGAAIGIERLLLLLEPFKDQFPIAHSPALTVIMPLSLAQNPLALLLADTMQAEGLCVDSLLDGDSLKSMMRRANKMGAAYALIIGDQEQQAKTVVIKNLMTGDQEEIAQIDVVSYLRK